MSINCRLQEQIEALVREQIAECRAAVLAEVERAFAVSMSELVFQPDAKPKAMQSPTGKARRKPAKQRTAEEIRALAERFYALVCVRSGETMAVLAPQLGVTYRELHRPVAYLKRQGRVRSIGERSQTRYFPLVGDAKATPEVAA